MGIEDIFDDKVEEAPVVETPPIEAPVVEAAPVVETPEAETPEAVEAPLVEEVREDKSVPLHTFLDMRDKVKAAEARVAEMEAAKPREAPKVPDPYDDPKGYDAHIERVIEAKTTNNRFQMSDVIAKREHGEETVQSATEWALGRAKADPVFAAQYMREAHPIDWIVRQHKRDGLLSQIGDDPDAWVRTRAAELGLNAPQITPVIETPQAPITPPRSLASTPSKNGGVADVPLGPLASTEAVFTR